MDIRYKIKIPILGKNSWFQSKRPPRLGYKLQDFGKKTEVLREKTQGILPKTQGSANSKLVKVTSRAMSNAGLNSIECYYTRK